MEPLIKHYDLNYEAISIQAAHAQAKILLKKRNVGSLGDIAGHLLQLKRAYNDLYELLCIVLKLGVCTALCERWFSCLIN